MPSAALLPLDGSTPAPQPQCCRSKLRMRRGAFYLPSSSRRLRWCGCFAFRSNCVTSVCDQIRRSSKFLHCPHAPCHVATVSASKWGALQKDLLVFISQERRATTNPNLQRTAVALLSQSRKTSNGRRLKLRASTRGLSVLALNRTS
jgi:hypothetical protein